MVQRKYDDSEDSADAFFLVHREMKLNAILFSFFQHKAFRSVMRWAMKLGCRRKTKVHVHRMSV